jgi:[ribosomal protein S18]-alanine N-acetyltransferase
VKSADNNASQASSEQVRLRSFLADDLPAMYALDQACFRAGISYSLDELNYFVTHPSSLAIIAEMDNEQCAGFCIVEKMRRRGLAYGHIITIDVQPHLRRKGIGGILMQALGERLLHLEATRCVLEVAVDDAGAQEFYASRGYQVTARLPNYYMGSLDAFVMEKELG